MDPLHSKAAHHNANKSPLHNVLPAVIIFVNKLKTGSRVLLIVRCPQRLNAHQVKLHRDRAHHNPVLPELNHVPAGAMGSGVNMYRPVLLRRVLIYVRRVSSVMAMSSVRQKHVK